MDTLLVAVGIALFFLLVLLGFIWSNPNFLMPAETGGSGGDAADNRNQPPGPNGPEGPSEATGENKRPQPPSIPRADLKAFEGLKTPAKTVEKITTMAHYEAYMAERKGEDGVHVLFFGANFCPYTKEQLGVLLSDEVKTLTAGFVDVEEAFDVKGKVNEALQAAGLPALGGAVPSSVIFRDQTPLAHGKGGRMVAPVLDSFIKEHSE